MHNESAHKHENPFLDVLKMPLLGISVFVISFIGIFFNLPLMIPPLAASLFIIFLRRNSEFAKVKNVLIGHLIGFAAAFAKPLFINYLPLLNQSILEAIIVAISVLIAGILMAILNVEHPPAIATTLIFYYVTQSGVMLFGIVPLTEALSFVGGLILTTLCAYFMVPKEHHEKMGHHKKHDVHQ